MDYWHAGLDLPQTLDIDCLLSHLQPEDELLVTRGSAVEDFTRCVELSTELYGQLIGDLKQSQMPLRSDPTHTVPGIDSQFLMTLMARMLGLPEWSAETEYRRELSDDQSGQIFKLLFNGLLVAVGNSDELAIVEASHRGFISGSRPAVWDRIGLKFRETLDRYVSRRNQLDKLIEVRVWQRTFVNGPCEVCEVWGGL